MDTYDIDDLPLVPYRTRKHTKEEVNVHAIPQAALQIWLQVLLAPTVQVPTPLQSKEGEKSLESGESEENTIALQYEEKA